MIEKTIKKLYKDGELRLHYEEISGKGVKYRLLQTMFFETGIVTEKFMALGDYISLNTSGLLRVGDGYEWNGPNVMRDKKTAMRASVLHDPLRELVNAGILSSKFNPAINDVFRDACKEDGMSEKKYKFYRWGLRKYWQGWFK